MRLWLKFKAWFFDATVECLIKGHKIKIIDGSKSNLVFQKGEARQVIDYFNGICQICERAGCSWEKYVGDKKPYKRQLIQPDHRNAAPNYLGRQDI